MPRPLRHQQAEWRCALPGFPERLWNSPPDGGYYMGHLPIYDGPEPSEEPRETHDDGCPGAWYRCGFVTSLIRYERPVSEGGYSENLHLSRCNDPLVLDAIQYLEHERARALNHLREKMSGPQ